MKLYRGMDEKNAKKVIQEGIAPSNSFVPLYFSPSFEIAKKYSLTRRGSSKSSIEYKNLGARENPAVIEVSITERDLRELANNNTSERVIEKRIRNLKKAVNEDWEEYTMHHYIPPRKIKIVWKKDRR